MFFIQSDLYKFFDLGSNHKDCAMKLLQLDWPKLECVELSLENILLHQVGISNN
jgi:hypothetical protein